MGDDPVIVEKKLQHQGAHVIVVGGEKLVDINTSQVTCQYES
jgi:hypothetical protein